MFHLGYRACVLVNPSNLTLRFDVLEGCAIGVGCGATVAFLLAGFLGNGLKLQLSLCSFLYLGPNKPTTQFLIFSSSLGVICKRPYLINLYFLIT